MKQRLAVTLSALLLSCSLIAPRSHEPPLTFAGEVRAGEAFGRPIGKGLMFLLQPDEAGWRIEVQPETARDGSCKEYSDVIAIPLRGYRENDLTVEYGVTAADAAQPRTHEIDFVLDEAACNHETELRTRLLWPYVYSEAENEEYMENVAGSPRGTALVTIRDSKVSPSGELVDGEDLGKIDWLKFEVEIRFPTPANE